MSSPRRVGSYRRLLLTTQPLIQPQSTQASPDGWKQCVPRYQSTTYPEVRFWCLQTLADAIKLHHASLSEQDAAALRSHVASWVHESTSPATTPPVPFFIQNKLAQVCARLVGREYPHRWPSFFHDLLELASSAGDGGLNALTRVLDAIDDEVISSGDTHGTYGPNEVPPSVRVKDAMRADAGLLPKIVEALRVIVATGIERRSFQIVAAGADTARRYAEWVDVSLFTDGAFMRTVHSMMSCDFSQAGTRLKASEFLTAVCHKGMDHGAKVALIARLDLVNTCRALQAACASTIASAEDPEDPELEEGEMRAAALVSAVGNEVRLFG